MSVLFYCRLCYGWHSAGANLSSVCPHCEQETIWTTAPLAAPKHHYELTANDKKFLRSIRVQAEEPTS